MFGTYTWAFGALGPGAGVLVDFKRDTVYVDWHDLGKLGPARDDLARVERLALSEFMRDQEMCMHMPRQLASILCELSGRMWTCSERIYCFGLFHKAGFKGSGLVG